jgi:L-ascorbate metabolism protein UlaG (beta-lactamase superfamily)
MKMKKLNRDVEITYLGHSTFKIRSSKGKIILIDPWVQGNPACPEGLKKFDRLDIMAITHGHFDHMSDAVGIAKEHKPSVVAIWEIGHWMESKGVENCSGMNKGGTQTVDGIKFTMTHAQHSSGIVDEHGNLIYAGEPAGYVIEFENGFKIYHAGDTCIFSDMKLIAEIYNPELVMLPIGDWFTMSPVEASYACRFLSPRYVIPIHYATFPILTGTPAELRELTKDIRDMEIIELKPGETLT